MFYAVQHSIMMTVHLSMLILDDHSSWILPEIVCRLQLRPSSKQLSGAGVGIRRACVLVGSQKTLPIAVTVLNGLAPQIGGSVGLAVIPCVVSHLVQIVMDSLLVSQWLKQDANKAGHHGSAPMHKAA